MASMNEKYDTALIGILQNEGQIAKFLDVLLGFLYRRTDFYRVMKTENDKLGFPPGVAMKLLANIFKKYENLAAQDEVKRQKLMQERAAQSVSSVQEPKLETESSKSKAAPPTSQPQQQPPPSIPLPPQTSQPSSEEKPSGSDRAAAAVTKKDAEAGGGGDTEMDVDGDNTTKDKKEGEQERLQKVFQDNPESYNGAVRDNYSWSQSITDTDVRVMVPKTVLKGKDVQVDISKKRLSVRYRNASGGWEEVLNGDLTWEVRADECMWTLSPGQHVHINLEKKDERWWEAVLVDEPKINTRKIDCSRSITDLDDEAQAKIEEMMYNERQKRMGLPQSHEQKTMDMLRQAWDAEGSPFRGQPFDPSAISVDPSGVIKMK
ncbi:nudC domain-containing protein 3-like [Littorina saxatilis]|uniref:CS domain-containing protein n=1 Tax=Littorina saxatilis TaxID=31220 RepID=A0AAN9BVL5_9CAEN